MKYYGLPSGMSGNTKIVRKIADTLLAILKISVQHSLNSVDCQQCLTPVSAQRESSCPGFCSLKKKKSTIFVLQLHKLVAFDNICLTIT